MMRVFVVAVCVLCAAGDAEAKRARPLVRKRPGAALPSAAQPRAVARTVPAVPAPPPGEAVAANARAHELFLRGLALAAGNACDRAVPLFEEARRLHPAPALDLDLARCLDELSRFDEAIGAYQRFARSAPPTASSAPVVARIEERIRALQTRLAEHPAGADPKKSR